MLIRFFDVLFSFLGLMLLLPFFIIIALLILLDSHGGAFYLQNRVGKNNIEFKLLKFRTMSSYSDRYGSLTIGKRDQRITRIGYYLRKFKIDELPQLINVIMGRMSLVGPRPEVRKYVELYNEKQRTILKVKPGITDFASIEFTNENEILALSANPEKTYIEEIMPAKINLNMTYINNRSIKNYFKILFNTIKVILRIK